MTLQSFPEVPSIFGYFIIQKVFKCHAQLRMKNKTKQNKNNNSYNTKHIFYWIASLGQRQFFALICLSVITASDGEVHGRDLSES